MIRKELLNAGIEELEEQAGIVANIERYAINDGNGVRTTVFLKGCQLRCRWCSNPETQAFFPEMSFFPDKCIACRNCQKLCPVQALDEQLVADRKLCRDCYKRDQAFACTKQCYTKCRKITGEHMSARQVYEEVRRDVQFYEASGGGVTLSGGEPMAQPDFAYAMLRIFTERWIDTAIETCGFAEKEDYIQTVPYLNTIFMDIKQMDPQKHKEWTGQSNEKILENVKCVGRSLHERRHGKRHEDDRGSHADGSSVQYHESDGDRFVSADDCKRSCHYPGRSSVQEKIKKAYRL